MGPIRKTTIALICTDDGQHKPWVVYSWLVDPETITGELLFSSSHVLPGVFIELDCSRCPRKPRVRALRWRALCDWLAERARAGDRRVEIDLSKQGV